MEKKKSKRNLIIEINKVIGTPMMCGRDTGNSTKIPLESSGSYRKTRGVSMTRCARNLSVFVDKFRAMSLLAERKRWRRCWSCLQYYYMFTGGTARLDS